MGWSTKLQLGVVSLIVSMGAQAAQFKNNTVGFEVQNQIRSLMYQCYSDEFKFDDAFIPKDFLKSEYKKTLETSVTPALNIGAGDLRMIAAAVVPVDTVAVSKFMDLSTDRLQIDISALTPITSANNLTYVLNCTSTLRMALEQGFTFSSVPFSGGGAAGVKNALTVQADTSKTSHLLISYGWYNSPIAAALESPSNSQHGAANAALWNLYRSMGAIDGAKKFQVLKRFRGWFIAGSNTSDLSASIGASASASLNLLLFNAKIEGNSNLKLSSGLTASSYNLFLDGKADNTPDIAMFEVPLPDALRTKISNTASIIPAVSEITFIPGTPVPIKLSLPGMAGICEDAGWIISVSGSGTVGPTEVRASSAGACEISAELSLSDASLKSMTVTAEGSSASVTMKNGNNVTTLAPRVEKVIKLKKVSDPTFVVVGQPRVVPVPGSQAYNIVATISYSSLGIMRNIQANDLAIKCEGATSIAISPPSFSVNERDRSVELTVMSAPQSGDASNCVMELNLESDYTDTANKTRHLATKDRLTSFGFNLPKLQSL